PAAVPDGQSSSLAHQRRRHARPEARAPAAARSRVLGRRPKTSIRKLCACRLPRASLGARPPQERQLRPRTGIPRVGCGPQIARVLTGWHAVCAPSDKRSRSEGANEANMPLVSSTSGDVTVVRHADGDAAETSAGYWPINWSAIWVGTLAALAVALIISLIGAALGAHQLGPAGRIAS